MSDEQMRLLDPINFRVERNAPIQERADFALYLEISRTENSLERMEAFGPALLTRHQTERDRTIGQYRRKLEVLRYLKARMTPADDQGEA